MCLIRGTRSRGWRGIGVGRSTRQWPRPPCLVAFAACLASCAAGPDFTEPAAPTADAYLQTPLVQTVSAPGIAGGDGQRLLAHHDPSSDWWRQFQSVALDALEAEALDHSPTLADAKASLRAAREQALAGRGASWPAIDATVTASRNRDPAATLAPVPSNNDYVYNLITPQLTIGYSPDVFGLARRNRESLAAQADAARFAAIAAYNTLTTQVVVSTIETASLAAQVGATKRLILLYQHELEATQDRRKAGFASGLDVAAQQASLAGSENQLAALEKQLAMSRNGLAVLCGRLPGAQPLELPDLAGISLPRELPVSLPAELVRHRPDVRQAEAAWHAATAAVGVAEAERLPQIQLTANAGSMALAFADVFGSGTGFWNLAAGLTAPIFHGGELAHATAAARAGAEAAAAQYRATVLQAFEDVANTLAAIDQDARALQAAAAGDQAAAATLEAVQRRFHDGYASGLDVAEASVGREQAQMTLIEAQALRYIDTATLFQALGGGWWQLPESEQP